MVKSKHGAIEEESKMIISVKVLIHYLCLMSTLCNAFGKIPPKSPSVYYLAVVSMVTLKNKKKPRYLCFGSPKYSEVYKPFCIVNFWFLFGFLSLFVEKCSCNTISVELKVCVCLPLHMSASSGVAS